MRDVIQARCQHCLELRQFRPSAARLTLYSHGRAVLRFFCLDCHELNAQEVESIQTARAMGAAGVATEVVIVPAEVAERAEDERCGRHPITVVECDLLETSDLAQFNERWRLEVDRVGRR